MWEFVKVIAIDMLDCEDEEDDDMSIVLYSVAAAGLVSDRLCVWCCCSLDEV